ncbi:MAG: carboxypeptidase-like regulatory domain-containing protein [Acidobacteriota bacterium]|nr:carboxypeptidase-like regulatory domain-containing protein [Acidobacteriota bacterium]
MPVRTLPFLLALLIALLPSAAHAQFDAATMLGRITGPSGAAVPGATVTLTNLATGGQAVTVSDATGAYQFLNVRVGTYRIEAELSGFSTAVAPQGNVTVNARQRNDLALQIGSIGEPRSMPAWTLSPPINTKTLRGCYPADTAVAEA